MDWPLNSPKLNLMVGRAGRIRTDWAQLEMSFARYLEGNSQVTHALFSELQDVLQAYFSVRIGFGEDAKDLTQATLLKIHFARDRFDPKFSLKTWVFTIASRSLIDHWRGARNEIGLEGPAVADEDEVSSSLLESLPSNLLDPAMKTELHGDLNFALMKLKPTERSIVYLYGVEGLSMAEIASILSITEGAIKLRAHRAYQELRKILVTLLLVSSGLWPGLWQWWKELKWT